MTALGNDNTYYDSITVPSFFFSNQETQIKTIVAHQVNWPAFSDRTVCIIAPDPSHLWPPYSNLSCVSHNHIINWET